MEIKILSDKILLGERNDVIRIYIYAKLTQYGIKPYEHDIDIILELYKIGGYNNKEEQLNFINNCLNRGFKRSAQAVRNTLSTYTGFKILKKIKFLSLKVSEDFLPEVVCDKLILQPIISHKN